MVLNAIFNNISVISWWSVLLVELTGVDGETHRQTASHRQTLQQQKNKQKNKDGIRIYNMSGDIH